MAQFLDFKAADREYESIRRSRSDVAAIARATGYKESSIRKVKEHLFLNDHLLDIFAAQNRFPAPDGRIYGQLAYAIVREAARESDLQDRRLAAG